MSGDVSKSGWPFMSTAAGPAKADLEQLRTRALELLRREKRALHTGELAMLLQVPTHQVHVVMQQPLVDRAVRFSSSDGWDLTPPSTPLQLRDDSQTSL